MDERLENYIGRGTENYPVNIVIAGCSCSGKTSLAKEIEEKYKSVGVSVMHEDDYFKDLNNIPRSSMGVLADHPDAFHTEEFVAGCKSLVSTGEAVVPVYDMSVNKRTGYFRRIRRSAINVFEGLHAINLLDGQIGCLAVYLDPGYNICLERRIERDGRLWQRKSEEVISYWNRCIQPVSEEFIERQRFAADIIIGKDW